MPRLRYAATALLTVVLLGVSTLAALAQSDPFENLKVGQRVEVVLKNNTLFRGEVHWIAADRIKIDVTYDTTELQGFLTFKKSEIRAVAVLQQLSEKDKERILDEKSAKLRKFDEEVAERAKREHSDVKENSAAEAEADKKAKEAQAPVDPLKEAADKARKANEEILAKFPLSEWSKERYAQILGETEQERTPMEREFLVGFGAWLGAQDTQGKDSRRALLEKFPPEKGWGAEKLEELRVKELSSLHTGKPTHIGGDRVSNGRTRPSLTAEESEFMEHFDDWKQGLQEFTEEHKAAAPGAGNPSEETPKAPYEEKKPEGTEEGK